MITKEISSDLDEWNVSKCIASRKRLKLTPSKSYFSANITRGGWRWEQRRKRTLESCTGWRASAPDIDQMLLLKYINQTKAALPPSGGKKCHLESICDAFILFLIILTFNLILLYSSTTSSYQPKSRKWCPWMDKERKHGKKSRVWAQTDQTHFLRCGKADVT